MKNRWDCILCYAILCYAMLYKCDILSGWVDRCETYGLIYIYADPHSDVGRVDDGSVSCST